MRIGNVLLGTRDEDLAYDEMPCWDYVVLLADIRVVPSLLRFFHHSVELLDSGHVG